MCVEGVKLCVPLAVIVLFGVAGGRWYGMQRKRGQYEQVFEGVAIVCVVVSYAV